MMRPIHVSVLLIQSTPVCITIKRGGEWGEGGHIVATARIVLRFQRHRLAGPAPANPCEARFLREVFRLPFTAGRRFLWEN
jgi:hypothetical protein